MMLMRTIFVIFILVALFEIAESKPILTVTCTEPTGPRFDFGHGSLGTDGELRTSTDGFRGVTPVFVIDKSKDNTMLVIWGDSRSWGPAAQTNARRAVIVLRTADQISAVERYNSGIWLYSLYPKLGIGYFAAHRELLGGLGVSNSFQSFCKFSN